MRRWIHGTGDWSGPVDPLPHVWLGVSVESQQWADIRIPALLDTPAAVRWLSCEPLLGPVDLSFWLVCGHIAATGTDAAEHWRCDHCATEFRDQADGPFTQMVRTRPGLGWVVVGGESGAGARPMDPGWARGLRDQCQAADIPFFFKQWGDWMPHGLGIGLFRPPEQLVGPALDGMGHRQIMRRAGKQVAGRELDGRTWDDYPDTDQLTTATATAVDLPFVATVHRPGLPEVYLGFAFEHQAEHASWSLTDDLRNTQHVEGTTITHSPTPPAVSPLEPLPTDPYALAELVADEDEDLPMGHAFPDLFARLKAQEGYKTAARIWRDACRWLDRDDSEED